MKILIFAALLSFCSGSRVMTGGFTDLDPHERTIMKFANKGLKGVSKKLGTDDIFSLVDVVSAKVQVVAGLRYELVVHVQKENCKTCNVLQCRITVFEQAWNKHEEVSVKECHDLGKDATHNIKALDHLNDMKTYLNSLPADVVDGTKPKVILMHKEEDANVDDPSVSSAVNFAVNRINMQDNCAHVKVLLKVTKATKKVTNGMIYNVNFSIARSYCRKNRHNMLARAEDCGAILDEVEVCHATVWDRVWLSDRYTLSSHSCHKEADEPCDRQEFNNFKEKYTVLYSTQKEENYRFQIFCANMKKARHLQQLDSGTAQYGATKFADLTEQEFKRYVSKPWDLKANDKMEESPSLGLHDTPNSFDWRSKGVVTPVKNQGSCGSCWAFSTTGNIEGQWAINKKKLVSLSEQELVDCDKVDQGCEGGLPSQAYDAIMKLGGLESEKQYPYAGSDDKCTFNRSGIVVTLTGSVKISQDEAQMAAWLTKNGPISIGINAFAMQFYFGGISHPWSIFCNPSHLDHGVLIVGFGVDGSEPYWIIKNSWGPSWGEKGYYLVYRGAGVCGLNRMATSAKVV